MGIRVVPGGVPAVSTVAGSTSTPTSPIDLGPRPPWSLAPPAGLGRSIVVSADTEVPAAWTDAPRVVVDLGAIDDPGPSIVTLRGWSDRRVGAVIVVDHPVSMQLSGSGVAGHGGPRYPWQAPIGPVADLETLQWLMWSNSFDLRPGHFGWWAIERALQLGARLPTPIEQVSSEPMGDICTPDGRWCWIDAGPPRHTVLFRGEVLSGVALEHGSLDPSRAGSARAELSEAQRAAVEESSGSARVIAPAGSGKTRVLTERARQLLDVWRVPASAVTLLAFNRRARDELVERTGDLAGLQIRTLNAVALAVVNGTAPFAPRPIQRRTIGEARSRAMMSQAISSVTGVSATEEMIDTYLEALMRIRLRMRSPDEVAEQFGERARALTRVWVRYRAALERSRVVDFDGQIHLAIEVLMNDSAARQQAQRCCRLLLVDEFQDLTPAHLALIQLLSGPGGSIYGVGDDDQTIYGYAGAQPEWLLGGGIGGADHGVGAAVPRHQLDVNHRCPPEVVSAVTELLEHNHRRAPKRIAPAARSSGAAPRGGLEVICSPDPLADTVATVLDAHRCGMPTSSIAVLARVNALLVPVHIELALRGLGVNAPGTAQFTAHPVVSRIRAWWALSTARPGARVDPQDLVSVLGHRITGRDVDMGRDIGVSAASVSPAESAERLLRRAGLAEELRIRDLCSGHGGLSEPPTPMTSVMSTLAAARAAVADGATSLQWLDVVAAHGVRARRPGPSDREPEHDHLTALRQLATRHPAVADYGAMIDSTGDSVSSDGGVVLSTIHRVKGLEWPMVVLHHADASQMPHRLADDVEEERRIFHVGLTRSVERCVVVGGADPSPFIAEMQVGRP